MNSALSQKQWLFPLLLILLAGLVGLTTLVTPPVPKAEPLANRSIYNSAPSGYRAWSLAAQKSGLTVVPWEKPFTKLDSLPGTATMLMVEPFTFSKSTVLFGEKEADTMLSWVAEGNTLVLLDDFHRFGSHEVAQLVLERVKTAHLSKKRKAVPDDSEQVPAEQALPLVNAQRELGIFVTQPILSQSTLNLWPKTHGIVFESQPGLLDPEGNPLLVRLSYGKGALILGTETDLGDNSFLNGPANDNYQFLANLLRREGNPVLVNEYVHGYAETENLLSYLAQNTPLGNIFAQLLLGFILLVWLSAIRWTPKPQASNDVGGEGVEVNALEAYIHSMARIYARAQAASLVLAPQVNRIEILLRQRFRLSLEEEGRLKDLLGTSPGDYSSKEYSSESLVAALRQARLVIENQGRLIPRDLLRLARQLTLIEERLQYERHRTHSLPR